MEHGAESIKIEGLAELSAVRILVGAFVKYTREINPSGTDIDTVDDFANRLGLILDGSPLLVAPGDDNSIDFLVSGGEAIVVDAVTEMFAENPDMLTSHMTPGEIAAAQVFFPPTPAE